jgi:hypothetical protein
MDKTMRFFPLDYHELRICVRSHKMEQTKANLVLWPKHTHMESNGQVGLWQLVGHRADVLQTDKGTSSTSKVYSEFHAVVMVQRCQRWYLWQLLYYILASVFLCWRVLVAPTMDGHWGTECSLLLCSLVVAKYKIVGSCQSATVLGSYMLGWWSCFVVFAIGKAFLAWYLSNLDGSTDTERAELEKAVYFAAVGTALAANVLVHVALGIAVATHLRARKRWHTTRIGRGQSQ